MFGGALLRAMNYASPENVALAIGVSAEGGAAPSTDQAAPRRRVSVETDGRACGAAGGAGLRGSRRPRQRHLVSPGVGRLCLSPCRGERPPFRVQGYLAHKKTPSPLGPP